MATTAKLKSPKMAKPAKMVTTGVTPRVSKTGSLAQPTKVSRPVKSSIYMEAVGRRKRAIARVRATADTKTVITVNEKSLEKYFGIPSLCAIVSAPLARESFAGKYFISAHVKGGGIHAQAEAIRHGLSRILVAEDATQKKELKKMGFLKRDSRKVERKHFGLKKARKRKQWKKR